MKGTKIIVAASPRGVQRCGIIIGTPKPGTCMQIRAAVEPVNGLHQWEVYAPGADGEQRDVWVLLDDELQGKIYSDAYVSGTIGNLYCPLAGEEMNILKGDVAGTADDFAIGDMLMIDTGTGKVILSTGTPESEAFRCLETITDPTADQHVWCVRTGR